MTRSGASTPAVARRFAGVGLHSGSPCAVTLTRQPGPIVFATDRGSCRLEDVLIDRADQGVRIAAPHIDLSVDLVEHLLAAFAGSSIRQGVSIRVDGPEIPLLDGGAARFTRAITSLGLTPSPPRLRITRQARWAVGDSVYELSPAEGVDIEVVVDFTHRGLGVERARWQGDPVDFENRIASARTFGFLEDASDLRRRGRARGVDPNAVIVLDARGRQIFETQPRQDGELARHKLLDLLGDLCLFGGPPRGRLVCWKPGHAASHEALRRAIDDGTLRGAEDR